MVPAQEMLGAIIIVVVAVVVLQLESTFAGCGVSGLSDLGHVMVCQAIGDRQCLQDDGSVPGSKARWLQSPGPGVSGGCSGGRLGKLQRGQAPVSRRTEGYVNLRKTRKCREGTQESAEGQDRADLDEPGRCLDTVLCLILPGKHAGGPERVRAWLKVTQQLALGADLLAWGPGSCPPL